MGIIIGTIATTAITAAGEGGTTTAVVTIIGIGTTAIAGIGDEGQPGSAPT